MQNPIQNLDRAIVFEKPGILSEKLKTFTSSNYQRLFNNFCWNFAHIPYLPMSTKESVGFFLILFRTWVICHNKKPGFTHSQKPGL